MNIVIASKVSAYYGQYALSDVRAGVCFEQCQSRLLLNAAPLRQCSAPCFLIIAGAMLGGSAPADMLIRTILQHILDLLFADLPSANRTFS